MGWLPLVWSLEFQPRAPRQQVLDSVGETPEWLPYDRWKMYLPGDKLFDVGTETLKGSGFRGYRDRPSKVREA